MGDRYNKHMDEERAGPRQRWAIIAMIVVMASLFVGWIVVTLWPK